MKAAVVLLPLLSITSLVFISAPSIELSPAGHAAYRITNASLHVAQVLIYLPVQNLTVDIYTCMSV